ncbi:MAG: tRNA pseudouridine synthase A [Desulfurococcaceae archaeon]
MELSKRGIVFLDRVTRSAGYSNEWIAVRDAETSPEHGSLPYERETADHISFGIINLDKPPGPTSHEVVAWIKRIFGIQRAGHGGTLEPR